MDSRQNWTEDKRRIDLKAWLCKCLGIHGSRGHRRGERLEGTGKNEIMGPETKQIDGKMQQQAMRVPSKHSMDQEPVKTWLQVNQATSMLLLLLASPGVAGGALLDEAGLLRHACELLAEEWVIACLVGVQTIQTLASGVDERPRCGVLRGDTEIADISEGILALT